MPKELEAISSEVFDFLKARFDLGESVDENGQSTTDPKEMKVFSFDFKNRKGQDLGCVVISLMDDSESSNSLKVYFGDELANADPDDQEEWMKFMNEIRKFAKMHMLGFDVRNINKSTLTRHDIEPMFESSFGPIDGTVRTSRQPLENMQIIIKHTANIDPKIKNGRSRKIQKIYLANEKGEKFLLPFKSLMAARAMARHIHAGGTPYDAVGSDICSLVEEMTSISKFVRHMKHASIKNPEALNALDAARERVLEIKRQLSSLGTLGGYEKNKPLLTGNAGEIDAEEDNADLFGDQLDEDGKMALPHVMRAYRNKQHVAEEGEFENWANSVTSGKPSPGEEILTDDEEDDDRTEEEYNRDNDIVEPIHWTRKDDPMASLSLDESLELDNEDESNSNWTPCEEYGHRYELHGDEYNSCIDCGEPRYLDESNQTHWWPYGRHKFEPKEGSDECKACKMKADHLLHTTPPPKSLSEGSLLPTSYAKKQVLKIIPNAYIRHEKNGLYSIGYRKDIKNNVNDEWKGKSIIFTKITPLPNSTPREAWNSAFEYLKLKMVSKLTEADLPASAGDGSPLSHPDLTPMDDFRTPKEISKLKNTTGKASPFSLLSSREKDLKIDKEMNDIIRLSGHVSKPKRDL